MKNLLGVLVLLSNWHFFAQINADNNQIQQQKDPTAVFEENKGQMKDQFWNPRPDVLYYGTSEGMNYYIKNSGMSYQLSRVESWKDEEGQMQHFQDGAQDCKQVPDQIGTYRVDAEWLNANPNFEIIQGNVLDGYNNYYNVPEGVEPALFVKKYETLTLKNVWDGIDVHYYGTEGFLETDYLVVPGADFRKIQIQFKGAELSTDNSGNLIIKTPFGEIQEGALKVYQNNERIEASWKINEDNVVSFEIPFYNADLALRIDPLTRVWGTYYGGSGYESGNDITIDAASNVYLCGESESTSSISSGGFQNTWVGGLYDAFLVKFNNSGVRLWATYYGGSGTDYGKSTITDGSGNVYLAGSTGSSIGIASSGHQNTFGGSNNDAYLVKFNSSGIRFWGTYYGGSSSDLAMETAIDLSGNIYLTGVTTSSAAIASGGHQNSIGGAADAFLVKFNSSGFRLWGTYYGGSGTEFNHGAITTDAIGNIYLAGNTTSTSAISIGGHQNFTGGGNDAFLVKFNSSGTRLWGTYYGGVSEDMGISTACDASGNVYLSGYTYSPTSIASVGHQNTIGGGKDGFLAKFNSAGIRLWGTYYGGSANESVNSISVDALGNVYIAGGTESNSAIAYAGYQNTYGGNGDVFLVNFNSTGARIWGTYYGGSIIELGRSVQNDSNGNLFLAGSTTSSGMVASGGHQNTLGGGYDAFLVKFSTTQNVCTANVTAAGPTTICPGSSVLLSANLGAGLTYQWQRNGVNIAVGGTAPTYSALISGSYTVIVTDNAGCSATSNTIIVTTLPSPNVNAGGNISVCLGDSVTLNATGALLYSWNQGILNGNPFLPVLGALVYTVTGTASNGCTNTDQVTVTVNSFPQVNAGPDQTICPGEAVTLLMPVDTSNTGNFNSTDGLIYLTDGSGLLNSSSITITGFDSTSSFQSACDLEKLMLSIEHSYIGDIEIGLTCPNGQSVSILNAYNQTPVGWDELIPGGCGNGISISLGNDADMDGGAPGSPAWSYTFSGCNSTNGTICDVAIAGSNIISNSYTDSLGSLHQAIDTVGIYNFDGDINSLIGCPLNGNWTITVQDNQGIDDGYIFGWSLDFGGTTGSASASVVSWDNGVINNVPFTPDSTSMYTVIATSSAGCVSTDQVLITVLPFSATAQIVPNTNQTVCANDSLILTTNNSGAIGYQWYLNGQAISGATGNTLAVDTTGAYFVFIDDSSLCYTNSDTVNIQVLSSPILQLEVLGGQDTLCDNGYILVDGADQFLWQDSSQLNYLEVNLSGTYVVTGIDVNGCQATDSINVYMNYSTDTILYVSAIDEYTLNGETYYQTAVYTQILTNSVGCDSTIVLDLDLGYTGLSDLENEEFSVYPNPAKDYIFVNTIKMINEPYTLLDSSGRKVLNGQLIDTSQKLDLREIVTGLYYLKVGNKVAKVQVAK